MATVYLIPSLLAEDATQVLPAQILSVIKECEVIFAENERTTRRFFKALDKSIEIDKYEWFTIAKNEDTQHHPYFKQKLKEDKIIGIVSEAGCPGVADPGQLLVAIAQQAGAKVVPLVGPSSILLALMASGLNGQNFEFTGYLPIDNAARKRALKTLETQVLQTGCTKIFIETPYRNMQLMQSIGDHCSPDTLLCIAYDLTAATEMVVTKPVKDWKNNFPQIHKRPAIFLLGVGEERHIAL